MSTLILAEHDNCELKIATHCLVSAASQLGKDITILVAGTHCRTVAEQATQIPGVNNVLLADTSEYSHQPADLIAILIARLANNHSHILAASSSKGKDILPRAAALLDAQPISDVIAIETPDCFIRPTYAGNVISKIRSLDTIKFLTIRTTMFSAASAEGGDAQLTSLTIETSTSGSRFVSKAQSKSDRPDLTAARVVVSGGRGLQNSENFQLLYALAEKLNAAVGASRAAVDAGFVSNDMQVGQTGKIVAPDLYIAAGISGAIQHLAGIKDSKIIVAINKDPDAPIFQVADYGLVGDLFEVLPELTAQL